MRLNDLLSASAAELKPTPYRVGQVRVGAVGVELGELLVGPLDGVSVREMFAQAGLQRFQFGVRMDGFVPSARSGSHSAL
jgi:hypothetical protein